MATTTTHPGARRRLSLVANQPSGPLLLRELGQLWFASRRNIRDTTRLSYEIQLRRQIGPFLGDRPVSALTVDDMADFVIALEDAGYKPGTIRNAFMVARMVLDYAVRQGVISVNPARLLPGRERPRVIHRPARALKTNEITALLSAGSEPYRTIFAIGTFAGLRSGEIRGLQWQDIDLTNRRLHVRRQAHQGKLVPPKTPTAARTVALLDPLPAMLAALRATQPDAAPDDLLFLDRDKPLNAPRLCYQLRITAARAGIERSPEDPLLRVHDLRHTCASIMIASRADVAFVARQLGHATPATTLQIYAHLFDEAANIDRVRDYVSEQFAVLSR